MKTWELLDANGDGAVTPTTRFVDDTVDPKLPSIPGAITQQELMIALEACGMKLAPEELRHMLWHE